MSMFRDLRIAVRSLARVPSLWITVALTLALGIGANAAIFSVVRTVLLRPLANSNQARLLYIRQSAPGLHADNTTFSIPEINDLGQHLKSISELGTFSEIAFTLHGLGRPREIPAGVVDGHYFEVMGLRPILGRLLGPADDGPSAPGAVVLTYQFWTQSLHSDPVAGVAPLCLPAKSARKAAKVRRAARPRGTNSARPLRGAAPAWGLGPPSRREHKRDARRSRAGARANQRSSERRSASTASPARARLRLWACSSPRRPTRWRPKSSPTW